MNGVMDDFTKAEYVLPMLSDYVSEGLPGLLEMDPDKNEPAAREFLVAEHARMKVAEVWVNDQYQVMVDRRPHHGFAGFIIWHLSIKRLDREPIHDWRDLQEIKKRLCGADVEAIELYPNEARVVDTANQYHLFAFMGQKPSLVDKTRRKNDGERPILPIGWTVGRTLDVPLAGSKAKQRPTAGNDRGE